MRQKYIRIKNRHLMEHNDDDIIIAFSYLISHNIMAEHILGTKKIVSAGFITSYATDNESVTYKCHGKSVTLELESLDSDTALFLSQQDLY